jgi:hypothetical protein
MIAYAVIMFLVAILFFAVAIRIYKGDTSLIHDYHQTKVQDKEAYGKAFGKAMAIMAGAMAVSGIIALFGERLLWTAPAVLLAGQAAGIIAIIRVQKKYNGGVF